MFFADSIGFFALVCLVIQCGLAWIFAAFLGSLTPGRGVWLRSMFTAFVGLGIGLTAVSVRFLLAHVNVAGPDTLVEGTTQTRAFYAVYVAGKVLFYWGLVRGVGGWRRGVRPIAPWVPLATVGIGAVVGALVPTIEWVLLAQAPVVVGCCVVAVGWLRPRAGDREGGGDVGRRTVRAALAAMGVAWVLYAIATLDAGPSAPLRLPPLGYLLRVNSLIDLVLQVLLASGVIIAVMAEATRRSGEALDERDRLQRQLERDDKLRATATLVSGVAHEINNPLTAILGFVDGLSDPEPAVRDHAVSVVREQALRCRSIVQRMSVIGRRRALNPVRFHVGEAVERVVRGLAPQCELASVQVRLDVPVGASLVADATGFEQVLVNLLTNAVHASPRGGLVDVRIELGSQLRMVVRDRGPGVPEETRARIFEPFWTTKSVGLGTGLGLAVVEAIVGSHGGHVEVADAPGGGAAFTASWPCPTASLDDPAPASVPGGEDRATAPRGGRLLVVDDEVMVRQAIRRFAERQGWQVTDVGSAEEALGRIFDDGDEFSAIVCDLRMPGLSGIGFHDELRRRAPELLSHTLFVTGDLASPEAASFAAESQATIVTKPFLMPDLVRRIREVARTI
ncbi:MAG: hybrid sensor histidine kinase/response regulator [Planctomycetes bacterium]|nr:hybrid sensor histidine kinase/response regulator [Planctomycetota bacterium]